MWEDQKAIWSFHPWNSSHSSAFRCIYFSAHFSSSSMPLWVSVQARGKQKHTHTRRGRLLTSSRHFHGHGSIRSLPLWLIWFIRRVFYFDMPVLTIDLTLKSTDSFRLPNIIEDSIGIDWTSMNTNEVSIKVLIFVLSLLSLSVLVRLLNQLTNVTFRSSLLSNGRDLTFPSNLQKRVRVRTKNNHHFAWKRSTSVSNGWQHLLDRETRPRNCPSIIE